MGNNLLSDAGMASEPKEDVTGTVIAYDIGLAPAADGPCRQTLIVRTGKDSGRKAGYIIVRYENSCMKMLPERLLKTGPRWRFSLTRDVGCDQLLNEILYVKGMSPTGAGYQIPRVKFLAEAEAKKISRVEKLPCYALRPGDSPLKERLVTGVVAWSDGRPAAESYVFLSYADADAQILMVKADDKGQFTLPIFEGFEYTLQAMA